MRKRLLATATAGLLSAGMAMSAFAAPTEVSEGGAVPYSDGTDVYAGVILEDPDAKIKVHVPTLFAFVVNGSVDSSATNAISVENNNLLLPNLKVEVNEDDGQVTNHSYSIQTVGEGHMYFENCSTARDEENEGARAGIPVSIKGSIRNEGTAVSRNYWEHVGTQPGTEDGDFKHYRLSVDDIAFDTATEDGGFGMGEGITLSAPDLGRTGSKGSWAYTNLDDGNYAITGSQTDVKFGVEVGGKQNNYTQVEESAKVGNIVWTISYDLDNSDGVTTAPDNDYLETPGTAGTTTP